MSETIRALVLRELPYKESDRMLTLLTDTRGKMSIKAQGAVGKKSRIAAATQLLCFSEFTITEAHYAGGVGRYRIESASTVEQFLGLRSDISALSLGVYFSELLETVCAENVPDMTALSLGLNALYALSNHLYEPEHIKSAFELRLMCAEGFEPELSACAVCGREDVIQPMFSPESGLLHCRDCGTAIAGGTMPLDNDSLAAMRHIVYAQPKKIYSFAIPPEAEQRLGRVTEGFVSRQLDKRFSTLDYWKSVK